MNFAIGLVNGYILGRKCEGKDIEIKIPIWFIVLFILAIAINLFFSIRLVMRVI